MYPEVAVGDSQMKSDDKTKVVVIEAELRIPFLTKMSRSLTRQTYSGAEYRRR